MAPCVRLYCHFRSAALAPGQPCTAQPSLNTFLSANMRKAQRATAPRALVNGRHGLAPFRVTVVTLRGSKGFTRQLYAVGFFCGAQLVKVRVTKYKAAVACGNAVGHRRAGVAAYGTCVQRTAYIAHQLCSVAHTVCSLPRCPSTAVV